jgi:GT2 family glycosyltransferase
MVSNAKRPARAPAADQGVRPTVAAVTPHWNRASLLSQLLDSLSKQTRPFDEIIVVDNGSTDGSEQVAQRGGARFVPLGQNFGFARAVNRGIQETQAEWIAILNNDVTLEADWLATLLDAAENDDFAWFATGKILSAADHSRIDGTFDEISRGGCAWRCGSGKLDGPIWNTMRTVQMAPMTAALFRADLFRQVGLLDESFESYLEDVDFGLRCALQGLSGLYVPAAVACHQASATLGVWNSDTVRRISRNQALLIAKHFGGQPRFPIVAGQLLWGVVALRHGRAISYVRGKIEGLRKARALGFENTKHSDLQRILTQSEQTIRSLQRQTGFDSYWRAYFCLSRP